MGWGRVAGTERMLSQVVGNTETVWGKAKNRNGFSKPNFELRPKPEFFNPIILEKSVELSPEGAKIA
jgi:hypothetical protein